MTSPSLIARAEALLATGHVAEGVTIVRDAASRSDVDALFRLATWHLIGDPLPRDVTAARTLLRAAIAIGHVDAALMEIALTANGSGGRADWIGARALLDRAAVGDPVAATHRTLLNRMALRADGAPLAVPLPETLSQTPDVRIFRALLTPDECRHVATVGSTMLEPAQVADPATGRMIRHPVRTSHSAVIGPAHEDLVVHALNRRLAAASGTTYAQGEPLVVLHYAPGQEYRPHVDTLPDARNQRTHTVLVYLNGGYRGGETVFLHNGLTISGRTGDVLVFRNLDGAGKPDQASRHAGRPVTAGHKWLATRWIRASPHDGWAN